MEFSANPIEQKRAARKRKLIIGGLVTLIITVVALVGVTQLDKIREFFSRASGEEANIRVDTQAVIGTMPRPWRNLAQGGEGFDWRMTPVVGQVKALKPDYIRIDHIYDFYEIVSGTSGNLTFDWSKLDPILDDIKAAGAKPFIALSYMPSAISSGDIVAEPNNYSDWQIVVQKTIEHISGTKGVTDAYYEVWNEPDLFGGWKYYGEKNYLDLYGAAARGAANARGVQRFKIGGPGITALYKNWFDALAKYAINNNLRLDFFSWHRYNLKVDQFKDDMTNVTAWLREYPTLDGQLELLITEWGHDSNNHAGYDNSFSAAHTVAGSIEMVGVVDKAFVFEIQDGKDPNGQSYWGRWGMLTHNDSGAKAKPRYHALRLLDRISNQRLQLLGKGSWVKGLAAKNDNNNVEVVLANYDSFGKHSEVVPVTFTNIQPGSYTITKEFLSGQKNAEKIATTAAELMINVPMPANSVSFITLTPDFDVNSQGTVNSIGPGGFAAPVAPTTTGPVTIPSGPPIQRRSGF